MKNQLTVKRSSDFPLHHAPKGIQYHVLSADNPCGEEVEVDLVHVQRHTQLPEHAHSAARTLCLVIAGAGFVASGEQRFPLAAGDVVTIPAGAYHEFQAEDHELTFVSIQSPPIHGDYIFRHN